MLMYQGEQLFSVEDGSEVVQVDSIWEKKLHKFMLVVQAAFNEHFFQETRLKKS